MAVECLPPQHSAAAVVRQPTHRGVTSDTAVDNGEVQEVDLALLNAAAAAGLCSAQQSLCIAYVGAQSSTRTPTVLCVCLWAGRVARGGGEPLGSEGRTGGMLRSYRGKLE